MDINLDRSDNVDTFFIDEGGYTPGHRRDEHKNYRKQPIMITSPRRNPVQSCTPR